MTFDTQDILRADVVAELKQLASTTEGSFLKDTVMQFSNRVQSTFGVIDRGFKEKESEKIASAAHSLAGSAAILGATGVHSCCLKLEDAARQQNWQLIETQRPHLDKICRQAISALKKEFEI